MAPPGWYPDPWTPGGMRWWSGRDWTTYASAPPAAVYGKPTDGFALASLITSVVGLAPVGIVLGFVARRRIKRAEGRRDGMGLATAGIAVGAVYTALIAVIVALAVGGAFDEVNRDDYSGDEAQVANVIDRFEEAYENVDGAQICSELFTPELAARYEADGGCETYWSEGQPGYAEIDIYEMYTAGDGATVVADDEDADEDWTFHLDRYPGMGWRISDIE